MIGSARDPTWKMHDFGVELARMKSNIIAPLRSAAKVSMIKLGPHQSFKINFELEF